MARKDAENVALVRRKFYQRVSKVLQSALTKHLPAGAGLQYGWKSSLWNAATPVKLRCVRRGHELSSFMILCSIVSYLWWLLKFQGRGLTFNVKLTQ